MKPTVPSPSSSPRRLYWALAAYALLFTSASFTLDGKLRQFIWILLGALALKSWVGFRKDVGPNT